MLKLYYMYINRNNNKKLNNGWICTFKDVFTLKKNVF